MNKDKNMTAVQSYLSMLEENTRNTRSAEQHGKVYSMFDAVTEPEFELLGMIMRGLGEK